MADNKERITQLSRKLLDNTITEAEAQELAVWLNEYDGKDLEISSTLTDDIARRQKEMLQTISRDKNKLISEDRNKDQAIKIARRKKHWQWTAAAVIIVFLGASIYYYESSRSFNATSNSFAVSDTAGAPIPPGTNKAILTLADGSKIDLANAGNGTIAVQGAAKVQKTADGKLFYSGTHAGKPVALYNTLSTPKGGQFTIVLPDGTKVWINAASSLRFPAVFTGSERVVELSGEAYFKVVHNDKMPFKVKAGNRLIEDIGTVFDVNAYNDEPALKATLVEGSVRIGSVTLRPGQQAIGTGKDHITVRQVNVQDATAWVNGQLSMDDISLQEFMRQLSRWYDVDVQYMGNIPGRHFSGTLDRNAYLSDIIRVLENYGIHVKLEGKKIIVSP